MKISCLSETNFNQELSSSLASGRLERYKIHPRKEGFTNYNVCSSSNSWTRTLSPMLMGPFQVSEPATSFRHGFHLPEWNLVGDRRQRYVTNLENFWQYGKIFNIDVTPLGEGRYAISDQFLIRRDRGYSDPKPHRRVFPKAKGYQTVCGFYDGQLYGYLEARCRIYCAWYAHLVRQLPAYFRLAELVGSGHRVLILGYDGRDVATDRASLVNELLNPTLPFGHELVLVCMLQGFAPWEDLEVVREARRRDGGGWDYSV